MHYGTINGIASKIYYRGEKKPSVKQLKTIANLSKPCFIDIAVEAVIPSKSNHKHPREYDKELYKARHLIENFFAKLKQYRAIATRYDKRASSFLGAIYLAASVVWLN